MNNKIVRNVYAYLLVAATLVIIAGIASVCFVQSSSADVDAAVLGHEIQKNTMMVSGTGTVTQDPDEAVVYLGVQTQSEDAVTAQQDNARKMVKIIEALKSAGIAEDDMETTSYSLYPVRDYDDKEQRIIGYIVSNQLKVTIKDINAVGSIIDTAVDAGANEVQSVSFTLSDEKKQAAREKALKNAVQAASSDADALADALGVKIVGPTEVTTSGGSLTTPAVTRESMLVESGTPIEPGEISITAYVYITYMFI
jgi:uncharacterized protein YggE